MVLFMLLLFLELYYFCTLNFIRDGIKHINSYFAY